MREEVIFSEKEVSLYKLSTTETFYRTEIEEQTEMDRSI